MTRFRHALGILAAFVPAVLSVGRAEDFASHVDPYIGSGGHGHVFVGASVPFGAVQVGPTNFHQGWDWCSGYH
jgi:putative alpha-1,2-mannosidase